MYIIDIADGWGYPWQLLMSVTAFIYSTGERTCFTVACSSDFWGSQHVNNILQQHCGLTQKSVLSGAFIYFHAKIIRQALQVYEKTVEVRRKHEAEVAEAAKAAEAKAKPKAKFKMKAKAKPKAKARAEEERSLGIVFGEFQTNQFDKSWSRGLQESYLQRSRNKNKLPSWGLFVEWEGGGQLQRWRLIQLKKVSIITRKI